jgi:hypothetical protein
VRNTFFEANTVSSATPQCSAPQASSQSLWLDSSVPVARYSELLDENKPYLIIWKRRPHYIKVKLHCKMAISKTIKFYFNTTVKDALKYMASYLMDDENPALFSLQESRQQFDARVARNKVDPKGMSHCLTNGW